MNIKLVVSIASLGILILLGGCTALQTFSPVVRPGDTVTIAVGSPDGMTLANTTLEFQYDDTNIPNAVLTSNMRSVFKLHADPASGVFKEIAGASSFVDIPTLIESSGHAPYLGVIVVDIPTSIVPGLGQMIVRTTGVSYPLTISHINDLQANGSRIDMEILDPALPAGFGSASTFPYEFGIGGLRSNDLFRLEAVSHTVVAPIFVGGGRIYPHPYPEYGAIELKLELFPNQTIDGESIYLFSDDMETATHSRSSMAYGINNNGANPVMTVIFTSPIGKLEYFESRVTLVPLEGFSFVSDPVVTSVAYFDVNGNPSTGPTVAEFVVTAF